MSFMSVLNILATFGCTINPQSISLELVYRSGGLEHKIVLC